MTNKKLPEVDPFDIDIGEVKEEDFIKYLAKITEAPTAAIEGVSDDTLLAYAKIEMAFFPNEMTISAGMTRQKQQFCPNVYHASIKIDLSSAKESILQAVANANKGEKLIVYKDLKTFFLKCI